MSNSQVIPESIPDSPQTGNDGEVSAVVSNVRPVKIQIPVAVYTATLGHGWSKLPISDEEARDLWKKIRRKVKDVVGDELLGEIAYGDFLYGVLYEGGEYAFAFKLQKVENWDQSNRGADYCACAFVSRDDFAKVNFAKLLENDYFSTPSHTPASVIEYVVDDSFSSPTQQEVLDNVQKLVDDSCNHIERIDFDWRMIGIALDAYGIINTKWFFSRMDSNGVIQSKNEFGEWNISGTEQEESGYPNSVTIHDEGDPRRSFSDTTIEPFTASQPADTQHPMLGTSVNSDFERTSCLIDEQMEELKKKNGELERKLSGQVQSYRFMENEYRRELYQKDSRIKELQSNRLYYALAFLIGVFVAGLVFLCIQFVSNQNVKGYSQNNNGVHATADENGRKVK